MNGGRERSRPGGNPDPSEGSGWPPRRYGAAGAPLAWRLQQEGRTRRSVQESFRRAEGGPRPPHEEATAMMNQSTYHLLLSRGRKAGLSTRELNSALSVRPVTGDEQQSG